MAKQLPCCSRRTGKLFHDQNNLHNLAKKAAFADAHGRDISKFKKLIAETKAAIEVDKQAIIDHEAEHADGSVA